MIIGQSFDHDDADNVKLAQHDVYGKALGIVHDIVVQRWLDAEELLGTPTPIGKTLLAQKYFDHRTLQDHHDLLAAIWRAKRQLSLPVLPLDDERLSGLMGDWLSWLRAYMAECSPGLIGQMARATAFENTEPGYAAEDEARALLNDELAGAARDLIWHLTKAHDR